MDYYEDNCEDEMKNPNNYIWADPQGGIWSSNTLPWQETNPWTLNAPN